MITAIPAVKPTVTGKGMNLMKVPRRRKPMAASISPARKVARSVHAVLRYGRGHEHNEGAGRTANLEARSAKGRDKKPADDGGVESLRRRCTGGDGNRHGKGQRHDGD